MWSSRVIVRFLTSWATWVIAPAPCWWLSCSNDYQRDSVDHHFSTGRRIQFRWIFRQFLSTSIFPPSFNNHVDMHVDSLSDLKNFFINSLVMISITDKLLSGLMIYHIPGKFWFLFLCILMLRCDDRSNRCIVKCIISLKIFFFPPRHRSDKLRV